MVKFEINLALDYQNWYFYRAMKSLIVLIFTDFSPANLRNNSNSMEMAESF